MTDAEALARLQRIVRVIQEGRYSVLFATDRRSGRKLVVLCESTEFGSQLARATALALLAPLPNCGILAPTHGDAPAPRCERN